MQPTLLNIDLRPAKLANQIQAGGQMNGKDTVTAFYIPFNSVMLTKEEVNVLAGDPSWWSRHFDESPGKPATVLDADNFDTECAFRHKLEGAAVRFVHSLANEEVKFAPCKVSKIRLQPRTGGLTEISGMIETVPTLDQQAAAFLGQLNHELQIEILGANKSAKDRQTEMPLAAGSGAAAAAPTEPGSGPVSGDDQLEAAAKHHEGQGPTAAAA